jgi:type IV pilus assembly protein PilM
MPLQMPKLPQIENLRGLVSCFFPSLKGKGPSKTKHDRRIGLNIGRANLTACEVLAEDGKITIEHCVLKPLQEGRTLGAQLKEFFQETKFQSKKANVSLKGHGVVVRFLSFPRMSKADFTSAIQYEAEKYLPFNISEVVLDFHIVGEVSEQAPEEAGTMQVILVAARRSEVERLANAAREAGIQLNAIDVDIFALTNLFAFAEPEAKDHTYAVADFGAVDTSLGILSKGELVFSRDIAYGGNDLLEFIKRKLNVSQEEALKILTKPVPGTAGTGSENLSRNVPGTEGNTEGEGILEEGLNRLFQELKSSINYYYNQHENAAPIEKMFISGGFSKLVLLKSSLEKQMEIPVSTWDPLPRFELSKEIDQKSLTELIPHLPVCLGLGIRPK